MTTLKARTRLQSFKTLIYVQVEKGHTSRPVPFALIGSLFSLNVGLKTTFSACWNALNGTPQTC